MMRIKQPIVSGRKTPPPYRGAFARKGGSGYARLRVAKTARRCHGDEKGREEEAKGRIEGVRSRKGRREVGN